MEIRKATRQKAKLRLGICAPSGAGKTYSALMLAFGMGGKIGMIDTENGSGDLYAHLGIYDIIPVSAPYTVRKYLEAIKTFEQAGYTTIIIDSLSHAWAGTGGLLDKKDAIGGNSYTAWRSVTPEHNSLVEAMIQSRCHIIATMRSKTEYVLEPDEKGKMVPRKVGMAPVQREGMDYEFTVMMDIDWNHNAHASKDRTSTVDGQYFKITKETGKTFLDWLNTGEEPTQSPAPAPASVPAPAHTENPTQAESSAMATAIGDDKGGAAAAIANALTISGLLKSVKRAGTNGSTRYGLELQGDKRVFGTYSAPAALRAEDFVGKQITITYNEKEKNGKPVFEMLGFEPK